MNIEIKEYTTSRSVYLCDEIDSMTVSDVKAAIQDIIDKDYEVYNTNVSTMSRLGESIKKTFEKDNKFPDITLYIDSCGGSVHEGLGLYDFIKNINDNTRHRIVIICQGIVASMATIVCLASEERYTTKNTSFLIHSLSDLAYGKMQDMEDNLAECKRLNTLTNNIYLEHTNLSEERLQEIDKLKKDWWFGADKALEIGLIKKIL